MAGGIFLRLLSLTCDVVRCISVPPNKGESNDVLRDKWMYVSGHNSLLPLGGESPIPSKFISLILWVGKYTDGPTTANKRGTRTHRIPDNFH